MEWIEWNGLGRRIRMHSLLYVSIMYTYIFIYIHIIYIHIIYIHIHAYTHILGHNAYTHILGHNVKYVPYILIQIKNFENQR